jgi:endonuclease/exonuclease/phosphatase family metal-dependent hydrolase
MRPSPSPHIVLTLKYCGSSDTDDGIGSDATLVRKRSETFLTVATTHLKAKAGSVCEQTRLGQITAVLQAVDDMIGDSGSENGESAVIVLGDFNTEPFSDGKGGAPLTQHYVTQWRNGALRSAYPLINSEETHSAVDDESKYAAEHGASHGHSGASKVSEYYTTWKRRGDHEVKHVIDYIYHTEQLTPLRVLEPPLYSEVMLSQGRLPHIRYPSDHIAQVVDFSLTLYSKNN